jgi:hypothetical protein
LLFHIGWLTEIEPEWAPIRSGCTSDIPILLLDNLYYMQK